MGNTGTGKSTLANALVSGAQNPGVELRAGEDGQYRTVFETGHGFRSGSRTPGFFPLEKASGREGGSPGTYLVDGAGLNDSNLHREAPNQTAIQHVLKNALCFKLLVLLSGAEFDDGAAPMVELLTSVLRKCSKEALKKRPRRRANQQGHEVTIRRFIEPYFVRFEMFQNKDECDAKFDAILDMFNKKLKHY